MNKRFASDHVLQLQPLTHSCQVEELDEQIFISFSRANPTKIQHLSGPEIFGNFWHFVKIKRNKSFGKAKKGGPRFREEM